MKQFKQRSILALCTLALLLTTRPVWARGGGASDAGNGGGLSEKNLLYAYNHLADYIDLCLQTSLCRVTPEESTLLNQIHDSLPAELAVNLIYRSERATPGFFQLDGAVRVAKTGDTVGSPIFLNLDLLYPSHAPHAYEAVDPPLATSILIHELGHHHGIRDHAALDRLGSKLQALLLTQSERSEFWNGNASLITYQFNIVRTDADKLQLHLKDRIVLQNGTNLQELDGVLAAIQCPVAGTKALGVRLYNAHFDRGTSFNPATQILQKPISVWYLLSCKRGEETDHGDLRLTIYFHKNADGTFDYMPEKLETSQVSCKADPTVCH
jgi:hypothetical protein